MSKAEECRYVVDITAIQARNGQELRVEIRTETVASIRELAVLKSESNWDEAVEFVKKHDVSRMPLEFNVEYFTMHWDLLPPRHEFARFTNIDVLSLQHYPHLKHIDVTALPFLRKFYWYSIRTYTHSMQKREYALASIRITGLTQCKYLECLRLQGMSNHPFILKLKAPFRNLQALEDLDVNYNCVNDKYPLELVASQSLRYFAYNSEVMHRYLKAFRNIAKCACAVLCCQSSTMKANAFAKAIAVGAIHDPSLIVDMASVIKRTKVVKDILHARINAMTTLEDRWSNIPYAKSMPFGIG